MLSNSSQWPNENIVKLLLVPSSRGGWLRIKKMLRSDL
jgi:hypothetical protein